MTNPIPVYCVSQARAGTAPLALGLIQAYAQHGPEPVAARFIPLMNQGPAQIRLIAKAFGPGVWLCSDYLWSIDRNLETSRLAKAIDGRNVTVHGGPSAPSYPDACRSFLAAHPQVDIVCRGEGEVTARELLQRFSALGPSPEHIAGFHDVAGITFRDAEGQPVRTSDRPRLTRLDDIPSPYLLGLFDHYHDNKGGLAWVTLETNRGCPYQCTFCDWGSLIQQKIIKFDMERIKAEIDWIGRKRIEIVHIADANVGILERDLEIARAFAETKRHHGYPREITCSLTKNGSPRLVEMCGLWRDAGIKFTAIFSIQSTDPAALSAVKRQNIKTHHFEAQIGAIHEAGIDYGVELMMGLPGQTLESFKADLQRFSDLRVTVTAYRTRLLPNSPMASPEYRARHAIEVDADDLIHSTASCDAEALARMEALYRIYDVAINLSCLRYLLLYCQQEHGVPQVDLLFHLLGRLAAAPETFSARTRAITGPRLAFLAGLFEDGKAALDDLFEFIRDELGLAGDTAFETACAVNAAVLPRRGRTYPLRLRLDHDFVAYCRDRLKGSAQPLRAYGPGELVIEDPLDWASRDPRDPFPEVILRHLAWELASPLPAAAGWPQRDPSSRHGLLDSI